LSRRRHRHKAGLSSTARCLVNFATEGMYVAAEYPRSLMIVGRKNAMAYDPQLAPR